MSRYWANRRRREAQAGKPVVTGSMKRIDFHIDGQYYRYEFVTNSNSGFGYIFKGGKKIYGPYENDCTEEGRNVMKLLEENKIIRS